MGENDKNKGESDTVIDFTVIKLEQLAEEYRKKGNMSAVKQINDCLESHNDGEIDVIWRDGLPYTKLKRIKA